MTKREQIMQIFDRWEDYILGGDIDEEIADAILALPIEVPSEDEIYKAGGQYEKEYEEGIHAPGIPFGAVWANEDFDAGAKWAINEIIKRNK
jgi:hypothetical protein